MLETDTQISHYRILSKLGAGGMGEVYLAWDSKLDRNVAIKFLPLDLDADEQAGKRLLREAQAAAKLDHPNICAVHEVSEENGRGFIVMQYVEGETLDVRLKREPPGISESVSIARQVADGLAEAHAHGIIHRDIKPSNIIITPRGQAKVMDFGLAKMAVEAMEAEAETQSLLTNPGTIIGTIPYMSPEQARGDKLDARSDVFSFGILLYEMLTGHQPFAMGSVVATISAILTLNPGPLVDSCPDASDELQRIVSKCLDKDRERRFQSMREVAIDLDSVLRSCDARSPVVQASAKPSVRKSLQLTGPGTMRTALLTSRPALALGAVMVLAVVVIVYALSFKRSRVVQTAGGISVDSAAYDYYLRGKIAANSQNRESNENAIKLLEKAVKADPRFAPAFAELARAYNIKANFFAPDAEKKGVSEDAQVTVQKSLALDPNLAEGHFVRGYVMWTPANRFPHEQAIQSFKRAIALDPNLEEAHHQLGVLYMHVGLLDKAWDEVQKALEIDPSDTLARFRLGSIRVCQARYDEGLAVLKKVPSEADPAIVNRATAIALFQLGRTQEASDIVEAYLRTNAKDEGGNVTSVKAMILAKSGEEREAEETIQRAIDIGKGFTHFHHTTYNLASAYALMNKPDEALKWLQFTADDGFPCYPLFQNDANLKNLRKDDRFNSFMAKLKQQWEQYNANL